MNIQELQDHQYSCSQSFCNVHWFEFVYVLGKQSQKYHHQCYNSFPLHFRKTNHRSGDFNPQAISSATGNNKQHLVVSYVVAVGVALPRPEPDATEKGVCLYQIPETRFPQELI